MTCFPLEGGRLDLILKDAYQSQAIAEEVGVFFKSALSTVQPKQYPFSTGGWKTGVEYISSIVQIDLSVLLCFTLSILFRTVKGSGCGEGLMTEKELYQKLVLMHQAYLCEFQG